MNSGNCSDGIIELIVKQKESERESESERKGNTGMENNILLFVNVEGFFTMYN